MPLICISPILILAMMGIINVLTGLNLDMIAFTPYGHGILNITWALRLIIIVSSLIMTIVSYRIHPQIIANNGLAKILDILIISLVSIFLAAVTLDSLLRAVSQIRQLR